MQKHVSYLRKKNETTKKKTYPAFLVLYPF